MSDCEHTARVFIVGGLGETRCKGCGTTFPAAIRKAELAQGNARPSDEALGSAINALHDAEQECNSDARRARADGDELGASEHSARAQRLRQVAAWLEAL